MKRILYAMSLTISSLAASTSMAQPPGGGRGPGGPGGSPLEHMAQLFDLADVNRDGVLTKAELQLAMQSQFSNQYGRGGPGFQGPPPPPDGQFPGGPGGQGGPGGEPGLAATRPGEIIPAFVVESLGLSDRQKLRLAAVQKDVDRKLASILTEEQQQEMKNHQPPQHGPGHEAEQNAEPDSGQPELSRLPQVSSATP